MEFAGAGWIEDWDRAALGVRAVGGVTGVGGKQDARGMAKSPMPKPGLPSPRNAPAGVGMVLCNLTRR